MVLAMVFGLVFAMVAVVASLISPVLGAIVMIPMYLAMIVTIYLVMFGFYYHGWREIFADDAGPAAPPPAATVAI
jgi:hypothetical protein